MKSNVVRTERGWAGHFICADRCRFRRNTLLELGDVKIIVSTVGNMVANGHTETIGCERYFETMAFHAYQDGPYLDADVQREVGFKSNWSLDHHLDADIDIQADAMHEAVVAEISERMLSGRTEES